MLGITSPTLVINEAIARKNIKRMVNKANQAGVEFRPHFKTHQSKFISELFKQQGVTSITVSSIQMAKYFIEHGWLDVTIAFPFNILEIDLLNSLSVKAKINILVVDGDVVKLLDNKLDNKVYAYIELDADYGRSGIPITNIERIQSLKMNIDLATNIEFAGFYTHAGHTYKCRDAGQVRTLAKNIIQQLSELYKLYKSPICFGDTPSCSVLDSFGSVSQISPGNFVFYDWMQHKIGACEESDIAVALFCPVVAKYGDRNELLIHGGAVHLSKEYLVRENGDYYFGVVADKKDNGWGVSLPGNYVKSISQEHGIISCTDDFFESVEVGDLLPILPIHSCLTADLMGSYLSLEGNRIDHLSSQLK
ncbi:MAG: hypothetical protein WC967_03940 [Balneolaceae bacterium]